MTSFKNSLSSDGGREVGSSVELDLRIENFIDVGLENESCYLIEDLIDKNASVLFYAGTNTGKTFVALDLAFHVAMGLEWHGRKVEQGAVFYIAAEGGKGIRKRIVALKKHYGAEGENVPLRLAVGNLNLRDAGKVVQCLIEEIRRTRDEFEQTVALVIVDTLSRTLAGGDENSNTDMGNFVRAIDLIRSHTEAAVMIVHHTGKDSSKGARGHSLLKAAVDTEFTIVASSSGAPGHGVLTITKQRDYELGKAFGFKLRSIDLAEKEDGKKITSCVVMPSDDIRLSPPNKLSKHADDALDLLKTLIAESGVEQMLVAGSNREDRVISAETWRLAFKKRLFPPDVSRKTVSAAFIAARQSLLNHGSIGISASFVFLKAGSLPAQKGLSDLSNLGTYGSDRQNDGAING